MDPCIGRADRADAEALRRLRWRARRGLLENDLLIGRFLDQQGDALKPADADALARLLDLSEAELFDLLLGHWQPTAACNSSITFIDGDRGELLYRGYPIEQLATHCNFLEVCYLILYGELPDSKQRKEFVGLVSRHTMVHEQMQFFMRGFRRDTHPMSVLTGLVGAMSAFYPDSINVHDPKQREISAIRMIAKMPTLVAMANKYAAGQPYMYPRNDLSYAANFMHMMFATPCEDYHVNPVLVRALDRIFILHADHEQNASTSTVRLCASSGTNP